VAPLNGTTTAHHDAGTTRRKFNFGEAAPVGNHSKAINDFNEGRIVSGEWKVGWQAYAAAALPFSRSWGHVLYWRR
jgi:hypothetical protein